MVNPLVYISVLNWNQHEQTIRCLESLAALDYPQYRVIVVDNASDDGSVSVLRQRFPDVTLIEAAENSGYAGGHQHTVDRALQDGADLVWILNNDLTVQPDTLSQLVTAYQTHGMALYGSVPLEAAAPDDLNGARVLFASKYFRLPFRQRLFVLWPFRTYGELFPLAEPRPVAGLSGSSLLIPTAIIRAHGFMDTTYFLYGEEVDYCFRLREQGIASIIVPRSVVFHRRAQSTAGSARLGHIATYYRTRNQILFIRRHNHAGYVLAAVVRNLIMAGLTSGRVGLQRAGFILRGTWDGLRGRRGKTLAPEDTLTPDTRTTDHDRAVR